MASTWLTPGKLLLLFCAMNMLVYIDRGARRHTAVHICCKPDRNIHSSQSERSLHDLYAGVIASNGVNGDKASQQGLPAYGIVVY